MATSYTTFLGLALPVTGELSGTWGDTVNNYISNYLDAAIAGAQTVTTDTTLTKTTGSSLGSTSSQYAIIIASPASANITITAPAASKIYTIINTSATYTVKIVGAGPTTGVTLGVSEKAQVAWNGSDFIKISNTGGAVSFTNVTVTGTTTLSGLTASTALALDASKNVVSVTNTGTGNNVLSASPTLTGTVAGASLSLSSLTSGRVTYAGASGLLQDSANLTFDGTNLGLAGGTATGVAYLNGSKVLTTGSALVFDGTTLAALSGGTTIIVSKGSAGNQGYVSAAGNAGVVGTSSFDMIQDATSIAYLYQRANQPMVFGVNNSEQMRLTSTGLGIGTSSPSKKLEVANSDALIYGITVGRGSNSVASNTAVGASALLNNTTGTNNTAVGNNSMSNGTVTGTYNTASGWGSLFSNSSGSSNTAFGASALQLNTTASNNTAVGYQASYSNTTASYNTSVGYQTMYSSQTGGGHSALGYQALYSITQNIAGSIGLGYLAGFSTTTGAVTAIGTQSLYSNTTGTANVAVGNVPLYANTTGSNNTAIGDGALRLNTTASNNTAVGYQSLYSNNTSASNTAVGYQALYSTTTNGFSTAVGFQAGVYNTTGYLTVFGDRAATLNTTGTENAVFGRVALNANTTGSYNVAVGTSALNSNTTASNNTAVGYQAGYSNTTGTDNSFFGYQAGFNNTTGATRVTAVGYQAAYSNTTGAENVAMGRYALRSNTTGGASVAIGHEALYSNATSSTNTAVGYQSLYTNTSGANTALGYQTLYFATSGGTNTAVGYQALYNVTTGGDNTAIGRLSGSAITTGSKNTIIGEYNGNQGGLDIRTASNYIVLSDGDGNPRLVGDSSGNFGIGTGSPGYKLDVRVAPSSGGAAGAGVTTGSYEATLLVTGSAYNNYGVGANSAWLYTATNDLALGPYGGSGVVKLVTGGSERMRLDSSGNLGLGVTPSAWSGYKVMQLASQSAIAGAGAYTFLGTNWYNDGAGNKYIATAAASLYQQNAGVHSWYNAPSGTAGNAITFTQAMTLDASGNLGIGTSSPAYKLHVQNNAANTDTFVGQASTVGLFTQWRYNATTASAYGEISTYGGANNLYIQNQGSNGSVFICVNGGNVGIGTASPNASAILDAQSTTKGVRMPNMTTTQKNAIASPAAGLMVFDTTLAKLCVYSGSAWQTITSV